jgi:hypothetical protein
MTKRNTNSIVWSALVNAGGRRAAALLLALVMVAGLALPAAAQDATPTTGTPTAGTPAATEIVGLGGADISGAVAALMAVQAEDGGFIGFSGESDPGVTTDAVMALVAAEDAGADTGDSIDLALKYLEGTGASYAEVGVGQLAKLILAVDAAGGDPTDFAGQDLWATIEDTDFEDGTVGSGYFDLAYVVLAAVVMGSDRTSEFSDLLAAGQLEDGSWAYAPDAAVGDGDTNTTALAIQAIVASGAVESPAIESGLTYLASARAADGGYAYQPTADGTAIVPDANSTALVMQAMIAAATSPDDPAFLADAEALAGFQNPSGQFRYTDDMPDDNLFATVQALPAVSGASYPVGI